MSDVKAGFPRVAPPPAHIPLAPRPWAEVPPMAPEQAVRCDGWTDDKLLVGPERLLREERARYRRHMLYAGGLIGVGLIHIFVDPGPAMAAFIRGLLP